MIPCGAEPESPTNGSTKPVDVYLKDINPAHNLLVALFVSLGAGFAFYFANIYLARFLEIDDAD